MREALLDAVLHVVAEVGVDAVTHRRVAEVAGLPLASTTYWFKSKEHLLRAALERAAERDIERLRGLLGEAPEQAPDPLGLAVGAILGPGLDAGQTSRGWLLATYALMLEAARRPALREVMRRWTDAYMEALPPLLGAAGSAHPRSDAELVLAAADGLLVERLASDDTADLAPRLHRLADALVSVSRLTSDAVPLAALAALMLATLAVVRLAPAITSKSPPRWPRPAADRRASRRESRSR